MPVFAAGVFGDSEAAFFLLLAIFDLPFAPGAGVAGGLESCRDSLAGMFALAFAAAARVVRGIVEKRQEWICEERSRNADLRTSGLVRRDCRLSEVLNETMLLRSSTRTIFLSNEVNQRYRISRNLPYL